MGKGTGDLYIKCFSSDPIIASERYGIIDYWRYDSSIHSTADEIVNWSLPTGNFEITVYVQRGTGGAYVQLGDGSTANRVLFAHTGSESKFQLMCGTSTRDNGSGNNVDHTLQYIDGVLYYTVNGNTVQLNAPTGFTHILYKFAPWGNSKISNIRIKPL